MLQALLPWTRLHNSIHLFREIREIGFAILKMCAEGQIVECLGANDYGSFRCGDQGLQFALGSF